MRSLQKGSFSIGQEGDDGSAQRGRSVIYDCLVVTIAHSSIVGSVTAENLGRLWPQNYDAWASVALI